MTNFFESELCGCIFAYAFVVCFAMVGVLVFMASTNILGGVIMFCCLGASFYWFRNIWKEGRNEQ